VLAVVLFRPFPADVPPYGDRLELTAPWFSFDRSRVRILCSTQGAGNVPVYEFYCEPCNTLFNFYSKTVRTAEDSPVCPRCRGCLQKRVTGFSVLERTRSVKSLEDLPFNQQRLSDGMQKFMAEHERLREEDPARADGMMKKFSRWLGGVYLEEDKKRAMQRVLDSDDPLAQKIDALESLAGESDEPRRDENLYEY
jgi:hypothetical protein